MKIMLKEWAASNFRPAPCKNTLSAWVKTGKIAPAPVFIGRAYFVEENARYIADKLEAPKRPDLSRGNRKLRLAERIALDEAVATNAGATARKTKRDVIK